MKSVVLNKISTNFQGNDTDKTLFSKDKSLLKLLTCGSVDDGKSTLIGCLLHDTKHVYDDQLSSLNQDSKRYGTQGMSLDYSLLVDGLKAEIEQGITIDVAYRYFSTKKRKFIIVDTPGHEQYTRNMVTGASTCSLSILLIDARKGMLEQTKRHAFISYLLGIKYLIVAINKMDLVDYKHSVFYSISKQFLNFLKIAKFSFKVEFVPISALLGENVVVSSVNMNWYTGLTLLRILEDIDIVFSHSNELIFPVQYVNRPNLDFRGYSGTIVAGKVHVNQQVKVLPSGLFTTIKKIVTFDGDLSVAQLGQSITLVLNDNIDISRGDIIVDTRSILHPVRELFIDMIWMSEKSMRIKDFYLMQVAGKRVKIHIKDILYHQNINDFTKVSATKLQLNCIGYVHIICDEPIIVDLYKNNKIMGGLIFIDLITNITVGAGIVRKIIDLNNSVITKDMKLFEIELNSLICRYFPEWKMKKINK
ncbi:MAG: sulfate adenylyltransferase subunit CysN [Buchnera aphidicola (Eriosoma harunire)]